MADTAVELRREESRPVAVVRRHVRRTDLARVVPACCGLVWRALGAQGLRGGRHVAIYLDHAIHLEVGVEVDGPFLEQGEMVRSFLPAGLVATAIHLGPYQTLGRTHDAIQAWCQATGRRLAGPCWEIYGHWQQEWNDHPAAIRTDVGYLLEADAADQRSVSRS